MCYVDCLVTRGPHGKGQYNIQTNLGPFWRHRSMKRSFPRLHMSPIDCCNTYLDMFLSQASGTGRPHESQTSCKSRRSSFRPPQAQAHLVASCIHNRTSQDHEIWFTMRGRGLTSVVQHGPQIFKARDDRTGKGGGPHG